MNVTEQLDASGWMLDKTSVAAALLGFKEVVVDLGHLGWKYTSL